MMRNSYIMNIVLYLYTVGNDYSSLLVSGFMSQEKRGLILTISDLSANMPMKKQADLSYRLFFPPIWSAYLLPSIQTKQNSGTIWYYKFPSEP